MAYLGGRHDPPTVARLSVAVVNFSTSGDNTIVSAVTGQSVRIFKMFLVISAATNLTFKDGSVASTGAMPFTANGSFTVDYDTEPWNVPVLGQAWIINSSNAVHISGTVFYTQGALT